MDIIEELQQKIKEIEQEKHEDQDYFDGLVDGILIAIRTFKETHN